MMLLLLRCILRLKWFFGCKFLLALGFLNLLTTGIVFRKRNTLCFTCHTLILTHPSWERKVSNLLVLSPALIPVEFL